MRLLKTLAVAFSTFSAIPMPQFPWEKGNLRYALCAFPLVGLVTGGLCWVWVLLCQGLGLPAVLRGAGLCLVPVLVTGGIHLDGFCDTADALASHGTPERRQEILRDPHVGAFGVIRLVCLLLLTFALWTALPRFAPAAVVLSFCLSRSLSGLAVAAFPLAEQSSLAGTFARAADRRRVRWVLILLSVLLCLLLCLCAWEGVVMAAAALAVFLWYRRMARVKFGGLSGDLAGWFLQTAEVWMLLALCGTEYLREALLRLAV